MKRLLAILLLAILFMLSASLAMAGEWLISLPDGTDPNTIFGPYWVGTATGPFNMGTNAATLSNTTFSAGATVTLGGEGRTNWYGYAMVVACAPSATAYPQNTFYPNQLSTNVLLGTYDPYSMWKSTATGAVTPVTGWWRISGAADYGTPVGSSVRVLTSISTNTVGAEVFRSDIIIPSSAYGGCAVPIDVYLPATTTIFLTTYVVNNTNTLIAGSGNRLSLQYIGK